MSQIPCPLCGGERVAMLFNGMAWNECTKDEPRKMTYTMCECGLGILDTPEEIDYDGEYRTKLCGAPVVDEKEMVNQLDRAYHVLDFIAANGLHPVSVLDVGSSAGVLLASIRRRFGSRVFGVDLDTAQLKIAKERFNVDGATSYAGAGGDYDLVTCIHTLEHVPDPIGLLRDIPKRVNAKQLLMIEVPNLWGSCASFWHLWAFSVGSLVKCTELAGWCPIGRPHVYSRSNGTVAGDNLQMLFWRSA